jgi:hypothetical protein
MLSKSELKARRPPLTSVKSILKTGEDKLTDSKVNKPNEVKKVEVARLIDQKPTISFENLNTSNNQVNTKKLKFEPLTAIPKLIPIESKGLHKLIEDTFVQINKSDDLSELQYNLERYILTYDRGLIPQRYLKNLDTIINRLTNVDYYQMTKPRLVGSFKNECYTEKGFIDFLIYHTYDKKVEVKINDYITLLSTNFNSGDEVNVEIKKLSSTDFVTICLIFRFLSLG